MSIKLERCNFWRKRKDSLLCWQGLVLLDWSWQVRTCPNRDFWSNFARFGFKIRFLTKFLDDSAWFLLEKLKKHVICYQKPQYLTKNQRNTKTISKIINVLNCPPSLWAATFLCVIEYNFRCWVWCSAFSGLNILPLWRSPLDLHKPYVNLSHGTVATNFHQLWQLCKAMGKSFP